MSQSLKVPVVALIAKAEMERERILTQHAALKERYAAEMLPLSEWRMLLAEKLRLAAYDIETGKARPKPSEGWSNRRREYAPSISASVSVEMPIKPAAVPNTSKVDRHLRLLNATSQETISVRTDDDFAAYL